MIRFWVLLVFVSKALGVRIIHHHIPKTGGASLKQSLIDAYEIPNTAVWNGYDDLAQSMSAMHSISLDYTILTGHFNTNFWQQVNASVYPADIFITEVREPFNRMISDYLFRKNIPHSYQDLLDHVCDRKRTDDFPVERYRDYHIRLLSRNFPPILSQGNTPLSIKATTQTDLEDSVKVLRSADYIFMVDFLDRSLYDFEQRFGKKLAYGHTYNTDGTSLASLKKELRASERLYAAFREYNDNDYALYEAAQALTSNSALQRQPIMSRSEACTNIQDELINE